ncbi:hypothetical protein SETIT_4G175100v2 [Setaria italica]|uniref:Uncharacterized protein n=2 Tax=Setaria TaxID=4554 RepID=K3Y409_SETIT|nr:hypothetical protein SETIT_4G175100v2 [Setaria italica]TKW21774.1 hypothetical protein SEVIR_4G143400v2 [Setaria viridis]RCV21892.1 hypothetical protein SETIT_4G175100v2 [Setaria italica]RCV21893.1 hypothetical protein SETIT_4G175100v2 [Setaria italica]RCV21894.1 hypothetical protein SETIT_4G175100v2 [Setaria italica]
MKELESPLPQSRTGSPLVDLVPCRLRIDVLQVPHFCRAARSSWPSNWWARPRRLKRNLGASMSRASTTLRCHSSVSGQNCTQEIIKCSSLFSPNMAT